MGWAVNNGPDKLPTFHPAERFRKRLYRPDAIKLLFEKGKKGVSPRRTRPAATRHATSISTNCCRPKQRFDEMSGRSEERQLPLLSLPWVVES
jgi:hypothetical protein